MRIAIRIPVIKFATLAALALSLSACGDSGTADVSQWMKEVRQQTRVAIKPLSEPKKFTPFSYDAKNREDPYSPNTVSYTHLTLPTTTLCRSRWSPYH